MSDGTHVRRDTRAVADRLVGTIATLKGVAQTSSSIAARVEIVMERSEREADVEMVRLASEAATLLSDAAEGVTTATRAANRYLSETL